MSKFSKTYISLLRLASGGSALVVAAAFCLPALAEPIKLLGAPPGASMENSASSADDGPNSVFLSPENVRELLVREALFGDIPPELALAVAKIESDFNPNALSSKGARGVMQIMPATASSEFGVKSYELWDPAVNVRIGVKYLAQLYEHYGQRWDAALSHYNGGSLDGDTPYKAAPSEHTRDYVESVLALRRQYEQDSEIKSLIADVRSKLDDTVRVAAKPFSAEASFVASQISPRRPSRYAHDGTAYYRVPTANETPSMALYHEIDELRWRFRKSLQMMSARDHYMRDSDWRTP